MKEYYTRWLQSAERELQIETTAVRQLLHECKVEHVAPPKDYWHKKNHLENRVKALKLLLETTK